MALTTFKLKQVGAQKGYDLLKKKSDALTARLRAILKEIKKAKQEVAKEMQGATFSISEAAWAAGDFRKRVIEAPQRTHSLVRVVVKKDNVAGVKLPVFSIHKIAGDDTQLDSLGLGGGASLVRLKRRSMDADVSMAREWSREVIAPTSTARRVLPMLVGCHIVPSGV
jgi:V-type H+-transporting ATPase subunit D